MEFIKQKNYYQGITVISLNRQERRNALNIPLMTELCDGIEATNKDPHQRVIILTGEGPVFCSGLDLKEAQEPDKKDLSAQLVARMLKNVHESRCITMAAVHGAAFAGGAGLIAACDFVIAEEKTLFGFPETRRGLVAAQVMPLLLRQIPWRDLKELLLFGETITAERALKIGMINRISDEERLMDQALYFAEEALKGAPLATIKTKQLMEELYPGSFGESLLHALEVHYLARESEEAKEGISAFLEKREPKWVLKKERL